VTGATRGTPNEITCAGGAVVDQLLHLLGPAVPRTSNPATAASSHGGVARNVAENLARLGVPVRLCSVVGDDDAGRAVRARLEACGAGVQAVAVVPGASTASYVAVLDPAGELVIGVAAMEVLERIEPAAIEAAWPAPSSWLFLDCNLRADVIAAALRRAAEAGTPMAVDAVSIPKVTRLSGGLDGVRVLFCNLDEARALLAVLPGLPGLPGGAQTALAPPDAARALIGAGAAAVVLTLGPAGALIADAGGVRALPARPATVVDVTGAGDALVAGTLSGLAAGATLDDAVRIGLAAAALTVAGPVSVRPDLRQQLNRIMTEDS
jgi:pseudouridine kinase